MEENQKEAQKDSQAESQQPAFGIEKLYVRDFSVEVPNAPQIYLERETPQVEVHLGTQGKVLSEGTYEVSLTVTVTAKIEEKTVFLVEVCQAGIFRIVNVPQEQIEPLIAVECPGILFPYAREAVSDAVTRAGFPSVVLQPVNFGAMYMARLQEQQQAPADTPIQ